VTSRGAGAWEFLPLSLAASAASAPTDSRWLHEEKLDGYRIEALLRAGAVRLFTRNAHDWTARFARVAAELAALPVSSAVLDGEVIALDADGAASFQRLQQRIDAGSTVGVRYHVFDLLEIDGTDLRGEPLAVRREALSALLTYRRRNSVIRTAKTLNVRRGDPLEQARELGLEGVISKRVDAPYVSGRHRNWLKVKVTRRQEMVVIGFTEPEGSRDAFGALLLGVYDDKGILTYAGKVGSGFDQATLVGLHRRLLHLEVRASPVAKVAGLVLRSVHWVQPTLVAEVGFAEWTDDGRLRQPVFKGLREDKDAMLVRRE